MLWPLAIIANRLCVLRSSVCGRNNTKLARANYDYEICTVGRYRCFRCCLYVSYTNRSYKDTKDLYRKTYRKPYRSRLPVNLLHLMFLHTAPTYASRVFNILPFATYKTTTGFGKRTISGKSYRFFIMAPMKSEIYFRIEI